MKKSRVFPVIGISISLIFLFLALRKVDFIKVTDALKHTNYSWVIVAIIVYISGFFIRAVRWKFILQSIKECKTIDMFYSLSISFMANNLLPLRMGELVGAYVNAKKHNISKTSSFATIVVSRVFDGLSLILFAIILITYLGFTSHLDSTALDYIRKTMPMVTLIFTIPLLFMYGMLNRREFTINLTKKIFFFVPENIINKLVTVLDSFIGGLKVLHTPKDLLLTTASSLCIWICESFTFYIISVAMGMHIPYPILAFSMIILAFGVLLPSSPGFIGVYEFFCVFGLGIFGVGKDMALTFALLMHSMQFFVILALGFFSLWKENISFWDISKNTD